MLGWQRHFPPSVPAEAGCLFNCCGWCSCVFIRGEPVSSYFSMACCSVVSYWCKWCTFIMLPCSHRTLILVLEYVGNFGVRLPPGSCSRHGVSVHCMCVHILNLYATGWPVFPKCMQLTLVSWYVASMLSCYCWMFSLSDALPMQSYPSKVWVLCQCGITSLFVFLPIYVSTWNRWYIMANTLKMLTS